MERGRSTEKEEPGKLMNARIQKTLQSRYCPFLLEVLKICKENNIPAVFPAFPASGLYGTGFISQVSSTLLSFIPQLDSVAET